MNNIKIAKQLVVLARELLAIEFDSDSELKKYKQEHDVQPGTKLTVKKTDKKPSSQSPHEATGKDAVSGIPGLTHYSTRHDAPSNSVHHVIFTDEGEDSSYKKSAEKLVSKLKKDSKRPDSKFQLNSIYKPASSTQGYGVSVREKGSNTLHEFQLGTKMPKPKRRDKQRKKSDK